MMASNLLSRLLPPTTGSRSIYETLRANDESSDASDIEERAGIAMLDEENLGNHDFQLDPALADAMDSQIDTGISPTRTAADGGNRNVGDSTSRWLQHPRRPVEADELDDEVPLSLLIENRQTGIPRSSRPSTRTQAVHSPTAAPVPGQGTRGMRAKWQATQDQQQLYPDPGFPSAHSSSRNRKSGPMMIDRKERAMWRWANVENLDNFLKDVYDYFLGNGFWSILLRRALNLL